MSAKKAKGKFEKLSPTPGGPYSLWKQRRTEKIPKDSNVFLYNLVDMYGSEEIKNLSEVSIGDYTLGKGTLFSLNVNVGRSIPRVEDGLKPVERRALYVMYEKGYYGKNSVKVSTVVGDMIAMVYPHGDQAPSETIYRMGRHRTMMIPYVQ